MPPLRIALLAHYPADTVLPAGAVKSKYRRREHPAPWVRLLSRHLARLPDTVAHVFVHSRAVSEIHQVTIDGLEFTFLPRREPLRLSPYLLYRPGRECLRPLLFRFAPDVVCGFGAENGYGWLACSLPWPRVFFVQGILALASRFVRVEPLPLGFCTRMEARLPFLADAIISETDFARRWALSVNPNALARVVAHPLDTDFLAVRPSFAEPRILAVSGLAAIKGPETVLRAFARCSCDRGQLVFVGGGETELRPLAESLGVASRVEFAGYLDRHAMLRQMERASTLALGSRSDTAPYAITEAHAAGLPVIATRAGGIPEMVHEGRDGFLVDIDDHVAMAAKLDVLLADSEMCRRFGAAGREKVRRLNDPDRVAPDVRSFLDEVSHLRGRTKPCAV